MKRFIGILKIKLHSIKQLRAVGIITFLILGITSTVWFLIRVIPKPSRASYPCMRASAPIMSAFVIYLISLSTSLFAFRKFKLNFSRTKYLAAASFLLVAVLSIIISGVVNKERLSAAQTGELKAFIPNDPIGTARGIHPGRVVWVWNKDATDETCTNTTGDFWSENTNAAAVDSMLAHGIINLAGESTLDASWDAIFRYFNSNHGRGDVGYTNGEKVYIKINLTNSCCSVSGTARTSQFNRMDATPELSLALLRHLIEVVGVAQSDIYIGDPFRIFYDIYWNMCHSVYPDVNYCSKQAVNGRYQTTATDTAVIKFSNGLHSLRIPQEYMDATYFINMPCLKTHNEGAITLTAKNHQGSILQDGAEVQNQSAMVMHPYLPANDLGSGKYRHLVDYMGHEKLGGNTLISIVDGIWAGKSWEGYVEKWQMEPFNGDYPSSLFLSQDEVAIQSVCYDFLLTEYENKPAAERYPYMDGCDDFLYQAADASYWPADIEYDPEGDGTVIGSLGVFEHWDNAENKKYSRNLNTGNGIELITDTMGTSEPPVNVGQADNEKLMLKSYPNPASDQIFIDYSISSPAVVIGELYTLDGEKISVLRNESEFTGSHQLTFMVDTYPSGIYLFRLQVMTSSGTVVGFKKIIIE